MERIQKKLDGWKEKMLSLGRRITLLNAIVSSIPLYFLSFFHMPKWVELHIDKIRGRFHWKGAYKERGGYPLVKWAKLCNS